MTEILTSTVRKYFGQLRKTLEGGGTVGGVQGDEVTEEILG